jgi:hypothetical protein
MGPSPLRASRIVLCLVPGAHRGQEVRGRGKILQAYQALSAHIPGYNMGVCGGNCRIFPSLLGSSQTQGGPEESQVKEGGGGAEEATKGWGGG